MHSEIEHTQRGLDVVRAHGTGPIGAWPNAGSFEPPHWQFVDTSPEDFARIALGWLDPRVRVIGGCCGLGPDHIRALSEHLA